MIEQVTSLSDTKRVVKIFDLVSQKVWEMDVL